MLLAYVPVRLCSYVRELEDVDISGAQEERESDTAKTEGNIQTMVQSNQVMIPV